jgi:hypothetical protein
VNWVDKDIAQEKIIQGKKERKGKEYAKKNTHD